MKLTFITDGDITYGLAVDQVYQGRTHEELAYAEITKNKAESGYFVRWNDDFFKPEDLVGATLEVAKRFVEQNHKHHRPESTGRSW